MPQYRPVAPGTATASGYAASSQTFASGSASGSGSSSNASSRPRYGGSNAPFNRAGIPSLTASSGRDTGLSTPSEETAGLLSSANPFGRSGVKGDETSSNYSHSLASHGNESANRYAVGAVAPATSTAYYSSVDTKEVESDDYLHTPDRKGDRNHGVSFGGFLNIFTLMLLGGGLLMLFAGYPILSHFVTKSAGNLGGFGLGGTNGTGQVAQIPGLRSLVDKDTPAAVKTWTSPSTKANYDLVFSDEFNTPGRTFWPGDDPFWEAVDLWYGGTADYEWYSPEAVNTTDDGALTILMTQQETHNLNFQSGMLQSWNKFCFQGGYIEFAAMLPGRQDTRGYWPGLWTMGNLGRPGYLGSTDGMWPYSYASCDWGTLINQTSPDGTQPYASLNANGPYSSQYDNKLSYLPGMRTSACTCPGEDHPGPNVRTSRSAPEIDVLEAQNTNSFGEASQSLQIAPFDADYLWNENAASFYGQAAANTYTGGIYQEAVSGITPIPAAGYIGASNARYVTYGFELEPDWNADGTGSIAWYIDGKVTWKVTGAAIPARPDQNMGRRIIPVEPLSIIMNLGISDGFQRVHWDELLETWGVSSMMKIDYVRVYQKHGTDPKVSCDPPDHPTAKYIADHPILFNNVNLTVFDRENYAWPKNRLTGC